MLTNAGVKLLDFGLAKAKAGPRVQADNSVLPTGTAQSPVQDAPVTEKGAIFGTIQYMAPEQIDGQDTDARTDIFACGALLYEMITGRKAGRTVGRVQLDRKRCAGSLRGVVPGVRQTPPSRARWRGRAVVACGRQRTLLHVGGR